jgi:uncharacterized glyoxalase superfamily protein PhnB
MGAKRKATRPVRKRPETLRIRTMSPGFTVNDLQQSLHWYCDVVGFTVEERWEREGRLMGVMLKAGQASLALTQDDWAKGRERTKGEGFRVYCTTAQDVDELAARIKERGGDLASEPVTMSWGARSFGLVDPDGFNLTISSSH